MKEEKKRRRKVKRVRNRVTERQKGAGRQPMAFEPDWTWGDWWRDLWKVHPAVEVWTRDCGTGWFLGHECRICPVLKHLDG